MRVAMVSKADRFGGGASRIAEELCLILKSGGHTAHHFVAKRTDHKPYMKSLYGGRRLARFIQIMHRGTQRLGLQELVPWEYLTLRLVHGISDYDVVHFHDLSSAVSPFTVRLVASLKPTVWTFHDCAGFTGGCIFPMDCERFRDGCGSCPQLDGWPLSMSKNLDFTRFMIRLKKKVLEGKRIKIIAPSFWIAEKAKSSRIKFNDVAVIPYGIDVTLYRPLEKYHIRKTLNLPQDRHIILISAGYIADPRKGIVFALQALTEIRSEIDPLIVVVGEMDSEMRRQLERFHFVEVGFLRDDRKKAEYFAAADVFLFCPLDDNLPLTILETMASATPLVGFATGGIPEMVEHQKNGYLAKKGDAEDVARGLRLAFLGKRAEEWGREARRTVESNYTYEIFLKRHLASYEQVIYNFVASGSGHSKHGSDDTLKDQILERKPTGINGKADSL